MIYDLIFMNIKYVLHIFYFFKEVSDMLKYVSDILYIQFI